MANGNAQGIDVSHYQGTVSWPAVRQAGIEFAFAQLSEQSAQFGKPAW